MLTRQLPADALPRVRFDQDAKIIDLHAPRTPSDFTGYGDDDDTITWKVYRFMDS